MSKGGTLTKDQLNGYLDAFYGKKSETIGVVLPGFHDSYQEAGLHPSFGFLESEGGGTFAETLNRGRAAGGRILQIATWNDYGEGDEIEPTRENGYRYLQILRRETSPKKAIESDSALNLPLRVYRLRKDNLTETQRKALDEIAAQIADGHYDEAEKRIARLEKDVIPTKTAEAP
jgi:hypothetical protein